MLDHTIVSAADFAQAPRRVEGPDKVTGRLRYAGDLGLNGPHDIAVALTSTQATGEIRSVDAGAALACPGFRLVMTHENAPRLNKVTSFSGTEIGDLLPLQDRVLRYAGQCIGLVVADTLENAEAAAALVQVTYSEPSQAAAFTLDQGEHRAVVAKKIGGGDPGEVRIGHAERVFDAAAHRLDQTFRTAPHHHNAIEPGAILAAFDDEGRLTVHVPTQFSTADAVMLGQAFGFGMKDRLPRLIAQVLGGFEFDNQVRVVSTMAGGAFGGKLGNIHLLLAPMAAKLTRRPLKLVLTRRQVFTLMPFRGETRQRLRIGMTAEGRIEAILDDAVVAQGAAGQFVEPVVETVTKAYAAPHIHVATKSVRLDTNACGWMRGPGASLGQFALETGLDMLAHDLGMDPLKVRLRNHADVEPDTGHEWSSKSLRSCYAAGAEAIGWQGRDAAVGSMRQGRLQVGYGMATSLYATKQFPSAARVILDAAGRATVETASHEIGQGTITAMSQIAAETLGLRLDRITFAFGDTRFPSGGMTVASSTTLSNGAAIQEAAAKIRTKLLRRAVRDQGSVLHRAALSDLDVTDGVIRHRDGRAEAVADLMGRLPEGRFEAEAVTGRDFGRSGYGRWAFGAQFARVLIDPDTAQVRVDRLVGAFAGGRVINSMLVRSQLLGGMVWGIGQAMMEESVIDTRTGLWTNANLAEALVPTSADIPDMEAIIIKEDDTRGHPLGLKGMGEIGSVGTAAAIGNAIFHATGVRLTALPFRIDRLLDGLVQLRRQAKVLNGLPTSPVDEQRRPVRLLMP